MRNLLWIGSPFFADTLKECGWNVATYNFEHVAVYGWHDLVDLAGFVPHVLVVADKSRPPFVLGVEDFPCLTVLYAVDTHIHSYLPWYAQGFDACLVSLRDDMAEFTGMELPDERICWFPPFAPNHASPKEKALEWDVLFVGTVDAVRTPKRKVFLEALQERLARHSVTLHVTQGDYASLYPQSRVVLNYCELGDLNFRVFEALGCGSCLVTPHIGHGLTELFTPGVDLLTYRADDVDDAAKAVLQALDAPPLRTILAKNGLHSIDQTHRSIHRATLLTDFVRRLPKDIAQIRRGKAEKIRRSWLRMLYLLQANALGDPLLRQAYLDASMGRFGHEKV